MAKLSEQQPQSQSPKKGISRRLALIGLGLAGFMPGGLFQKLQGSGSASGDPARALALAKGPEVVSSTWVLAGNTGTNPPTDFLGTTNAQPLVIKTNGSERMRVDQNGNVAIGTTSSGGAELTVSSASTTMAQMQVSQTTESDFARLRMNNIFALEGVQWWDIMVGPVGNGQLSFFAEGGGGNVMTLKASPAKPFMGVGIGTTTPTASLEVSSGTSLDTPQVKITQTASGDFARLRLNNANGTGGVPFWDIAAGPNGNTNLNFYAPGPGNIMSLVATPTSGKVGIGTTSPSAELQVSSGTSIGTPQMQITQTASGDFARLRLNNVNASGGVPFWDIAAGPNGNTNLNFYAQGSGNIMSLATTGVSIKGDLSVSGKKNFVQDHPMDPTKEIVYVALEGGEAGTYIRGTGKLVNGKAVIALPEHFSLVTAEVGLTIHLTPRGEWLQLYVVELTTGQSVVREAQGKSGEFDYLIQGVRKGHEQHQVIQSKM